MKIKHFFPGGNTADGFVNMFHGITPPWNSNRRTYVLKGGPGVGKNTLMNRVCDVYVKRGYDIDLFHCASYSDSLDAIRIPSLETVMVDGTSPHIIDPITPGAVDGIINLGVYLNESDLEKRKDEIKKLQAENSTGYRHTFSYLSAAGAINRDLNALATECIDRFAMLKSVRTYLDIIESGNSGFYPYPRKLFSSSITPHGIVHRISSIAADERIIFLSGPTPISGEWIRLADNISSAHGIKHEVFYSPLTPEIPEHIVFPDHHLCFTVSESEETTEHIDVSELCYPKDLNSYYSFSTKNERIVGDLISIAVSSLAYTKKIHDDIEAIYKDSMDFSSANGYLDSIILSMP